jgi:hypothetical protein
MHVFEKKSIYVENEPIQIVWPLVMKHEKNKKIKKSQFLYYEKTTN